MLTLGVTSRLLNPDDGSEVVRLGVAQQLRFKPQQVTLTSSSPPCSHRWRDRRSTCRTALR